MAIQLPNPGLGDGQTGDNEYVMWTKVKDNFSKTAHAASRLVGEGAGNLMEVGAFGFGGPSKSISYDSVDEAANPIISKTSYWYAPNITASPIGFQASYGLAIPFGAGTSSGAYFGLTATNKRIAVKWYSSATWQSGITEVYTTSNTTKEAETGYLVASSPVLKVQHDSFEKVHEAEQLEIEVNNIETGVYEITGTTGLREGDGWNLKPPKDVNGNVLCICEASEKDGVITLKTYAKKFDFETVSIVADYEQPTDIPEGAVVMLRFNDLPQEQLDKPIE